MRKRHIVALVLVTLFVLVGVGMTLASPGSSYEISWWTVDDGGGTSSGSNYALSGTIGQPDAGALSGGDYTVMGGFWVQRFEASYRIYLPVVLR